jgi:hypothetical protein
MSVDVRKFKAPIVSSEDKKGGGFGTSFLSPATDGEPTQAANTLADASNVTEDSNGDELSKTVIAGYLTYLEEQGIGEEQIFQVLDSLISEGNVTWTFKLFEKIPVVLKLRAAWVNEFILGEVERIGPSSYSRFTDLVARYNLAGSLVQYKDSTFPSSEPKDVLATKKFIDNLGFIVQERLVKQLAIFDRLVAVATSDWAVSNFTKPQQAE